ncbi:hypothetical protein PR202_ga29986 [Eleusine coracana subsp. coracana]|uniref:Uncharacterized protein n=1 Tax=Eleusine coracana subsp. coracana TaxID=191504 RepID=A0AAV5DN55_ELECO|nr:hypothetical protein PR202_ga29986 [Eleusine coracana subsp. coracana]
MKRNTTLPLRHGSCCLHSSQQPPLLHCVSHENYVLRYYSVLLGTHETRLATEMIFRYIFLAHMSMLLAGAAAEGDLRARLLWRKLLPTLPTTVGALKEHPLINIS